MFQQVEDSNNKFFLGVKSFWAIFDNQPVLGVN